MAMRLPAAVALAGRVTVLALLLAGCASTASARPTPVTSIAQIEGKWQGTITVGRGVQQFYYLTIEADGRMVAQWGMNWQWGKVTLGEGTAAFELSGTSSGTIRYYEGPAGRSMTLDPTFGGWSARVSPVR
jgi:uncharacterized protein YndB with AHSA1/START domain